MRIEQQSDGTFAKQMTPMEQKMLRLIYKEQRDRQDGDTNLQAQVNLLTEKVASNGTEISGLKLTVNGLQAQLAEQSTAVTTLQSQVSDLQQRLRAAGLM